MKNGVALLPSLPLWLAVAMALCAEGVLLAGLAAWPAPRDIASQRTPIDVSLVSVPVLAASTAAGGLVSAPTPEPEPEPVPPVAIPELAPTPVALVPPKPAPDRKSTPRPTVKPKPKPASPPKPTRSIARADQAVKLTTGGKASGQDRTTASDSARSGPSSPAAYLNNPAPDYPETARRMRQEGTVSLRVLVNASGQAAEVAIATSSGISSLDQAAIRAVRRWRFTPAHQTGQPIAAWVRVPIRFKLNQ